MPIYHAKSQTQWGIKIEFTKLDIFRNAAILNRMNTTAFSAIQIRYVETVSPGKDRPIYRVFAPVAWSDEQIKAAFVTAARQLVGYLFPANRPPAQASTFDVLITGDGKGHPLLSDEAHYLHLAVNLATQRAASSASGRSRTPADIFEIFSTIG